MGSFNLDGGEIEAVNGKDGLGFAEVVFADVDGDFAFFAGEKGDVIVVPEDGEDFGAVFAFEKAETHEESEARAGVFDGDVSGGLGAGVGIFHRGFDGGLGKILERVKIGELGKRRVVPLGLGKVGDVGLGGEPIEIAAEKFAGRRKKLKIQEVG